MHGSACDMWAFWGIDRSEGNFMADMLKTSERKGRKTSAISSSRPWQRFCATVLTRDLPYVGLFNWEVLAWSNYWLGFLSLTPIPHCCITAAAEVHSSSRESAALSPHWLLPDEDFSRRARNPDLHIKLQILKCWFKLKKYVQVKQNTSGGLVEPLDWQFSIPDLPQTVVVSTKLNDFNMRSIIIAKTYRVLPMCQEPLCWLHQSGPYM